MRVGQSVLGLKSRRSGSESGLEGRAGGSCLDVVEVNGGCIGYGRELWIFDLCNVLLGLGEDLGLEVHESHGGAHLVTVLFFHVGRQFGV